MVCEPDSAELGGIWTRSTAERTSVGKTVISASEAMAMPGRPDTAISVVLRLLGGIHHLQPEHVFNATLLDHASQRTPVTDHIDFQRCAHDTGSPSRRVVIAIRIPL